MDDKEPRLDINDLIDSPQYKCLFTDKQIKARCRIIDTSGNQWDIGESSCLMINFELIGSNNIELLDQVKYLCAQYAKSKSPSHALAVFNAVKNFLNNSEIFNEDSGDELADTLADEILCYFVSNRKSHGESELDRLRQWYLLGAKLRLPMFQKPVANALRRLKLKGHVKGLDVLIHIEGKSPLNSNQLSELRKLLQHYGEQFAVGMSHFWRLAATWLFITLGIRSVQLRQLMIVDLAVNVDEKTKRKTYRLNVPSAKKRSQEPRTQFKSRTIPIFLGEMLETLKKYNIQYLSDHNIKVEESRIPLFMPTHNGNLRKLDGRIALFEYCFSADSINHAPDNLLRHLNKLQKEEKKDAVKLKINPRRLRKTFATHAAACGTPAMMLMELLDHEDMQHVMIYYKLGANFANKIDKVYREQFSSILDYFEGTISLRELSDANKNEQVFGPDRLRRLVGIGFCGKNKLCRLAPPYSCYVCQKFEACKDKQVHEEVLETMVEEVNELFENNAAPGKFEMDYINGCRSLIAQLEVEQ